MTRRPRPGVLLSAMTALAVTVAVAPTASAQDPACPPNSRSQRCDPDAAPRGGRQDQPGRPPEEPGPEQPPAPPRQDRPEAPGPPSQPQPQPPGPVTPPRVPGDPAPQTPVPPRETPDPGTDASGLDTSGPPRSAPPDLGSRRTLRTRVLPPGDDGGPRVRVRVIEERARGIDGGWTVTVDGARPDADPVVRSRARSGAAQAGVVLTRPSLGHDRYRSLFTVVGQRSSDEYDAVYTGWLPLAETGDQPTTTITVTLFQ